MAFLIGKKKYKYRTSQKLRIEIYRPTSRFLFIINKFTSFSVATLGKHTSADHSTLLYSNNGAGRLELVTALATSDTYLDQLQIYKYSFLCQRIITVFIS